MTVQQQRLVTLYKLIWGIPDTRFDLAGWRKRAPRNRLAGGGVSDAGLLGEHSCGTTACAVGWACAYPGFKLQGLSYRDRMPLYDGYDNWDAVQKFFGIGSQQAFHLFSHGNYPGNPTKWDFLDRLRTHLFQSRLITEAMYHVLRHAEEKKELP